MTDPAAASSSWSSLLETLFEDTPMALAIFDASGRARRKNAAQLAFEQVHGELLGLGDFGMLDDLRSVAAGHADHFRRAVGNEVVEYELTVPSAWEGDEPSVFQRLFIPVAGDGGAPAAIVSVMVDVTERRRAEAENQRLQAQLLHVQKLESLGVLAGGIAHDFNNLLMGVLGHASLALLDLPEASPARPHVENIELAARRASEVARQMLDYAGKGRTEKRKVDLSQVVREMTELLRVTVSKGVAFRIELSDELRSVEVDVTQLRQVVMNLLTNASEAMDGQVGHVSLRTGVATLDDGALRQCFHGPEARPGLFAFVEVEDEGSGMDPETLRRAFDPFFSTKFTGRGLGLAGVMGIVRGHGGAIEVESEVGRGTRFRCLLPMSDQVEVVAARDETSSPQRGGAALRVLVVDDEPAVLELAVKMLEVSGFTTVCATSGEAGLDVVRAERGDIDVVLLDMTMPGLGGPRTVKALDGLAPDLPVVVMSGYDPELEQDRFAGCAPAGYLRKPFDLEELASTVRSAFAPPSSRPPQREVS